MGKAHFLVYCDRQLVDNAVSLILRSDSRIVLVSSETIKTEAIEDTGEKFEFLRGREQVCVRLVVGDKASNVGPYDGEYWIFVDGKSESLFKYNEQFAREIVEILIANGARETRKSERPKPNVITTSRFVQESNKSIDIK